MQFILIIKFCFIDMNDKVVRFQLCFFLLLLFLYLIDANVNHKNLIDGFPKSIYYIIVPGICVFFSRFFLGGKPNENKFIFNNYSFVSLIIGVSLRNKYNEISIDFIC